MDKPKVLSRNRMLIFSLAAIFLCFFATTAISVHSLSKVIDANEQNAASLIAANIHVHIRDYFIKESLREDARKPHLEDGVPVLTLFLEGLLHTTDIDTAYIVSDATYRYFSHQGLHKVIDPYDADNPAHEHDTWYPAFIETGLNRNIQIDTNPVEGDEWTIFFNNRILDADSTLLGVCGVGISMARFQSLLRDLEARYGVEIQMANETGTSTIGSRKVSIDKRYLTLTESTAPPKPISFLRTEDNGWQCRVGLDQFGWELIIAQSGSDVVHSFSFIIEHNVILCLCIFLVMFFVIHRINRSEKTVLRKMARIDVLTGLENRSAIDRVHGMLQDGSVPGALFIIDVDDFKSINDTLGHPVGDILLQRIGGILQNSFRKGDVVSRIGGDEFMVYSPGMHCVEYIREKAQKMENAVHSIRRLREVPENAVVNVSISIGVALFPFHGRTYTDLYHCADTALYHAKADGKNRFLIFDVCLKPDDTIS